MKHIYFVGYIAASNGVFSVLDSSAPTIEDARVDQSFYQRKHPKLEIRIVEGVILPEPETEAEATARLGEF